jgi:putative SOS response-associated peptidase YedK
LLSKIHNNPKLDEQRMPLILNETDEEKWLQNDTSEKFIEEIKSIIKPNTKIKLKVHTVKRLSGAESVGNQPEAHDEFIYEELPELT